MKRLLLMACFFCSVGLYSQDVEITADSFHADEIKLLTVFDGNVKIIKGKDILNAKKVVVLFDEKKQPLKYIATNDVKLWVYLKDKSYYASGEELVYEPIKNLYTLNTKAFLHEIGSDTKVYGDKIEVYQADGKYYVDSKKSEPVKIIFKIEDK